MSGRVAPALFERKLHPDHAFRPSERFSVCFEGISLFEEAKMDAMSFQECLNIVLDGFILDWQLWLAA